MKLTIQTALAALVVVIFHSTVAFPRSKPTDTVTTSNGCTIEVHGLESEVTTTGSGFKLALKFEDGAQLYKPGYIQTENGITDLWKIKGDPTRWVSIFMPHNGRKVQGSREGGSNTEYEIEMHFYDDVDHDNGQVDDHNVDDDEHDED